MSKHGLTPALVLQLALEGITNRIIQNAGNPDWCKDNWDVHYNAQKELERRLRLAVAHHKYRQRTKVPK